MHTGTRRSQNLKVGQLSDPVHGPFWGSLLFIDLTNQCFFGAVGANARFLR